MNNDLETTVAIMLTSHPYLLSSCIATACAINGISFSYAAITVTSQPMSQLFEAARANPKATDRVIADRGSGRLNDEPNNARNYRKHCQKSYQKHCQTDKLTNSTFLTEAVGDLIIAGCKAPCEV